MAEHDQRFDSFEQWVAKASSWLTRHAEYNNVEHGKAGYRGTHFTPLCFDKAGRICRNGGDFMRARDEGCFPVRWIWPDQVPSIAVRVDEAVLQLSAATRWLKLLADQFDVDPAETVIEISSVKGDDKASLAKVSLADSLAKMEAAMSQGAA